MRMEAGRDLATLIHELEYSDSAKVVQQLDALSSRVRRRMAPIKHKLVVMSGKGGVGKSMTTVNLALGLARRGHRVGVLDVDLNGPCVTAMLGMGDARLTIGPDGAVPPEGPLGIKVASLSFLVKPSEPVRWKGPMDLSPVWLGLQEMQVVRELLSDVVWGELDYLLADLPPGAAADKPPVIAGLIPDLAGALFVTTPSEVATEVVHKSVGYAQDLGIRVLGVIENMSGYRCPSCDVRHPLFPGDSQTLCDALDLPLLGRVPFDPALVQTFDRGEPLLDVEHPTVKLYDEITGRVEALIDFRRLLAQEL